MASRLRTSPASLATRPPVTSRPRARRPLSRGDVTIVTALLAVGIALPAAIAGWLGAFDIPRNDSWSYRRVLWEFVGTGHVRLVGWSGMTMVGQVFWTAPFVEVLGKGQWVPGAAIAVASAIGLICAYALARSLLPRAWAAGCVLLTLAVPGILLNTSSFMTDVTAFSAEAACLVFGAAALHRSGRARWALVAAAVATGCFGFSIREFDLAAPVAVLMVLAVKDRRAWRSYGFAGFCTMGVCIAIYVWTAKLPGAHLESLSLPTGTSFRQLISSYFTLGFLVSPLLPSVLRATVRSRARSGPGLTGSTRAGAVAAAVFLGLGTLSLAKGWGLFIGNYLMQQGVTGAAVLSGARPDLFPGALWLALEIVALIAGTALAFVAVAAVATHDAVAQLFSGTVQSLVAWFALLSAGGLLAYGLLVKAPLFDRYLSQLAFPVAVLLAHSCLRSRSTARGATHARERTDRAGRAGRAVTAATVGLVLVIGAVTAALTLNADSYDGARWQAGQLAVKAGFAPSVVDAGFEWVGSHTSEDANRALQALPGPAYEAWYDKLFAGFRDCAFVTGSPSPQPDVRLLRVTTYDLLGFAVAEHLWIYAVQAPGCGAS
jgi:Dolichyl-phosphate-mannose-protein mannosyltransferase